jgi:hypothetical protein
VLTIPPPEPWVQEFSEVYRLDHLIQHRLKEDGTKQSLSYTLPANAMMAHIHHARGKQPIFAVLQHDDVEAWVHG